MEYANVTIIGAGVVGLSVTNSISEKYSDVFLIERHSSFGNETSSRNSEVIHASIYYPQNFLKGKLCLEGNDRMYRLCSENNIPHVNCGKLIVATTEEEVSRLPGILETARNNGAKGVEIIDKNEIKKLEPDIHALAAIKCPTSGVVDSHSLMAYFEAKAIDNGANIVYNHELNGIDKVSDGYILTIKPNDSEEIKIHTKILINCAGLGSGKVSEMLGIDIDKINYRINYCKGMYFRVNHNMEKYPKMLIYPVPPEAGSVGVHTCPDLAGGMRLGPYDKWVEEIEYSVDPGLQQTFYEQAKQYLPFLSYQDISPDTAGIHPKTQRPGEGFRDFIIRHEEDKGLPGFINLVGIESPGLTSSPAIGPYVLKILNDIKN